VLFLLAMAATARALPAAADHPHLTDPLRTAAHLAWERPDDLASWRLSRRGPADDDAITVVVETATPDLVADDLERLGASVDVVTDRGVQARVRYEDLEDASDIEGVERVREPFVARPKGGKDVVTEGASELGVAAWHQLGFAGKGVEVAVLDIGFAGYEDLLGTELPEKVKLEKAGDGVSTDHGTAVAEIVHDIAPDAKLVLYQFLTDQEFLSAVLELEGMHVDVVNASVGFDNVWHADDTSEFSRAVDRIVTNGAVWVGAAGNENSKYAIGPLSDVDDDGYIEIETPAGPMEGIVVNTNDGALDVSFRWTDPMTESSNDLDLVAYNEDGSECGRSIEPQSGKGSSPYEEIVAVCKSTTVTVFPLTTASADLSKLEGFLYGVDGIDPSAWSYAQNLTLPADATGAISVGSCDAVDGTAPDYTSRGPTDDGRTKPDVCGPTAVSTATFGEAAFEGTSASSPHVAGLAALLVDALGKEQPEVVAKWITDNALDLGDEGADDTFGSGFAQAGLPPHDDCGCGLLPLQGAWIFVGVGFWTHRRRALPDA
jgi:subtilisin family serine protease